MVQINFAKREVQCKVVYYGPARSGKTANLRSIHARAPGHVRGSLTTIATDTDRTLFFDFLPLDLGEVAGIRTKIHLYAIPYIENQNTVRMLVLEGVDGIVFVADSNRSRLDANRMALANLEDNLRHLGRELSDIPLAFQWNKSDLQDAMAPEELEKALNSGGVASFSAVAEEGTGVFAVLKAMTQAVLVNVTRAMSIPAAAPVGVAAAPRRKRAAPPPQVPAPAPVEPAPVEPAPVEPAPAEAPPVEAPLPAPEREAIEAVSSLPRSGGSASRGELMSREQPLPASASAEPESDPEPFADDEEAVTQTSFHPPWRQGPAPPRGGAARKRRPLFEDVELPAEPAPSPPALIEAAAHELAAQEEGEPEPPPEAEDAESWAEDTGSIAATPSSTGSATLVGTPAVGGFTETVDNPLPRASAPRRPPPEPPPPPPPPPPEEPGAHSFDLETGRTVREDFAARDGWEVGSREPRQERYAPAARPVIDRRKKRRRLDDMHDVVPMANIAAGAIFAGVALIAIGYLVYVLL